MKKVCLVMALYFQLVTFRTGRLRAGDIITAINGQSCEYVTLSDAVTMLRNTNEVVHLRINKDNNHFRGEHRNSSSLLLLCNSTC